ncbi:hypothetical protein [Streptomyces johnsoniae]|uniref:Uncharacterized protein n=1 Tax=Streptomyces johnsoniae TaxID=3075532 RepID=A0ABU2S6L5_9ACTN|nr:hypothetical protein [Streptomyces sp. DSM 41886]MDT0444562.1 hypothetical protein [Streptomyces sp. DSM 41886]
MCTANGGRRGTVVACQREIAEETGLHIVPGGGDPPAPAPVLPAGTQGPGQGRRGGVVRGSRLRDPQGRPHGRPIHLASIHLCSHDPAGRATEAQRLTTLGDHGRSAFFAGDTNSFVHRPQCEIQPFPDWAEIADSVYFRQRTIRIGDEHVPDTEPDRILAGIGPNGRSVFTELGHFAATELGQTEALQPTATLWRTDQGPPQRIDRFYSTDDIADALISVTTLVNDDVREASDHAPVVAKFSLPRLRHNLGLAA